MTDNLSRLNAWFSKNDPERIVRDLDQNTQDWLDWRERLSTASEAVVIMDVCPSYYETKTWSDLRLKKAGLDLEPSEWAKSNWAHGQRLEGVARDKLFPDFVPTCIEYGKYGASLDGLHASFFNKEAEPMCVDWLEIKCPASGDRSTMLKRIRENEGKPARDKIQDHTWWQMVHQALVVGPKARYCMFTVWVDEHNFEIVEISAADMMVDAGTLLAAWNLFNDGFRQGLPDNEWEKVAGEWLIAKDENDKSTKRLKTAKEGVEALIPEGESREASGVKAAHATRKGSVDWQAYARKIFEDYQKACPEESIFGRGFLEASEAHRKDPTTSFSVTRSKRH